MPWLWGTGHVCPDYPSNHVGQRTTESLAPAAKCGRRKATELATAAQDRVTLDHDASLVSRSVIAMRHQEHFVIGARV